MIYSFACPAGEVLAVLAIGSIRCRNPDTLVYSASPTVSPVAYQVMPLDPEQAFIDGNLLGWGVVAAMVVAWSIHVLRRGI